MFSLWGGDAVFCNLDLRLDVLEQELQLPFTFVNGHIHELRIHIPWTKLGSEPVVITINTIECILKLSTDNDDQDSDRQKTLNLKKTFYEMLVEKSKLIKTHFYIVALLLGVYIVFINRLTPTLHNGNNITSQENAKNYEDDSEIKAGLPEEESGDTEMFSQDDSWLVGLVFLCLMLELYGVL
ncbi:vacuolar protein sorting-associated protein 13B [Caerostris extrusa]|uniref:Vacuolar protein sorting-associated protein 13B n=1 Tax=Caerostris extrusa TaxID=172846 RepID=A0AAV4MLM6_CAEEX|nr:vacuolar protein sorting-associated protein 13B [Caerostris extrusa]